jgi:hypothetical protein
MIGFIGTSLQLQLTVSSQSMTVYDSLHSLLDYECPLLLQRITSHTLKTRVTSRLAVYRQSVRPGDKPIETHDQ